MLVTVFLTLTLVGTEVTNIKTPPHSGFKQIKIKSYPGSSRAGCTNVTFDTPNAL